MQEVEKLLGESRDQVSAIRTEADQTAVREMEKARPLIRDQARALVEGITERLIGRRIPA